MAPQKKEDDGWHQRISGFRSENLPSTYIHRFNGVLVVRPQQGGESNPIKQFDVEITQNCAAKRA